MSLKLLKVQLMIFQHWFGLWLGDDQAVNDVNDDSFTDAYMRHMTLIS